MLRQVVKEDIFEEVIQGGSELISWNLQVGELVTSLLPACPAGQHGHDLLKVGVTHCQDPSKGGKLLQSFSATNFARVKIYPHL